MELPLNEEADLRIGDIAALMRHARKSASYKPALLKALVRCCQRTQSLQIALDAIGREFTKLYWNQTFTQLVASQCAWQPRGLRLGADKDERRVDGDRFEVAGSDDVDYLAFELDANVFLAHT